MTAGNASPCHREYPKNPILSKRGKKILKHLRQTQYPGQQER
jgi:hypothetical protein